MAIATGKYSLATLDMYDTYGFIPDTDCYKTFLQSREAKEPFFNEWPEENGKEYDLSDSIKFKDRSFRMTGFIEGTSLSNALSKKNALESAFTSAGAKVLNCALVGSFNVILKSVDVDDDLSNNLGQKTYLKININLLEVQ